MVGSNSSDSSNKTRRKSRFDDPNPGKRQGFQNNTTNNQTVSNNLQQNYNLQSGMGFPNNLNIQNTQGFQNNQNVEQQNQVQHPGGYQQHPPYQTFPPPHFLPPQMGFPGQNVVPAQPFLHHQPPVAQMPMNLAGFPTQPPNHLNGKEDLDSCRVGVMASILIDHKNKTKEFVPYKPLDELEEVPNKLLDEPVAQVTLVQRNLVEDFYEELEELFDQYKNEIDPNDPKFNYSRRKKYNLNKQLNQPIKIITPEEMMNPVKRDYYPPEVYSNTAKETSGLGSGEDLFESYRRKRSTKYHEHYAIREAVRKDPNCIVITPSDLCYSCNKPGHFAKDCKYGLT